MLNNLSTYLNLEEYRISILKNGLHVLNYKNLIDITSEEALLKIENKIIKIYGSNLRLVRLEKKELLINGSIKKVSIDEY